jgi:hypothetical protein
MKFNEWLRIREQMTGPVAGAVAPVKPVTPTGQSAGEKAKKRIAAAVKAMAVKPGGNRKQMAVTVQQTYGAAINDPGVEPPDALDMGAERDEIIKKLTSK